MINFIYLVSIQQVVDLEPICRILIKYFLDCLKKKQKQNNSIYNDHEEDDDEPILSSVDFLFNF